MSNKIDIYDVTLRDGAQGPGIKFSSEDQLRVVKALDDFGAAYIEGGQPGSNPKAVELFERTRDMDLKNAKMTAFGSTRYSQSTVEDDENLKALLSAGTEVVTIFAKSSVTQAKEVLRVSLDDNLTIISESVAYLIDQGVRVMVDGEHFFDGYFEDADYALACMEASWNAGAENLILCDTNGGRLPHEIQEAVKAVRAKLPNTPLGIHAHNDAGCATANSLIAIQEGAVQLQGTINGYGERTGNANLCSIIPSLQLKMGYDLVSDDNLKGLAHLSHLVAELANMTPRDSAPYIGRNSFTHKGGMHADAVRKMKSSYEHIDPILVGNTTHIPVSEVSGRSSLIEKAAELGIELVKEDPKTKAILQKVKDLENEGLEFEGADASLELLMRKTIGDFFSYFKLEDFRVTVVQRGSENKARAEAMVKLSLPDGTEMHMVSDGQGPVDALDQALRKALIGNYPELERLHLEDYKVRILDSHAATSAKTRVLIESSDGEESWYTVGISENIIDASYQALVDSIEYMLHKVHTK